MRFINGDIWWLWLLALLPVLIHLLIRQRLPHVRWAAMTFLLRALQKNRKRLLLETILLLLVRTAIVTTIVLVVLRPVAKSAWGWFASSDRQPVLSVIVLDDSASMAASDGISTRLGRARARIEQYLDELPGGSEVAVLLSAQPPTAVIREPTRDFDYVRRTLAKLSPRDSDGAMDQAIEQAGEMLERSVTPGRQILIVTDAPANERRKNPARLQVAIDAAREKAAVLLMTVPPTPAANVAVTEVSLAGGPQSLVPGLATTLWPAAIGVRLRPLHHSTPVRTAVELFVDGQKTARRQVALPPDRETMVTFEHRFHSPGESAIAARCDGDLFERDNERSIIAMVRERINVLMIDGHPAGEAYASATGFLRVALWPVAPDDPESVPLFDTQVVPVGGLESVRVENYPLIILADVPALPGQALQQIKAAVREGAGLLVIGGPQVSGANLAAMFADSGRGPLPIRLAPPIDLPADARPVGMTLLTPLAPALAGMEDRLLMDALSRTGWRTLRPVADALGPAMQTWATFGQGGAALVANTYGRGRVVYFGGSADRRGGDFPLSPAFVPFFQQLAFYLLGGTESVLVPAGRTMDWPAPSVACTLTYPGGTSEPAESLLVEDAAVGRKRIVLPAAERAGVYALQYAPRGGRPERLLRAAHVPSDESDTAVLDAAILRTDPVLKGVRVIDPEQSPREVVRAARGEVEFSLLGLLFLVVLLAAELLLIVMFTPRQVDTQALLRRAMRL